MRRHKNLKKHNVKDCPYHASKDKFLKRIIELNSIHKLFSMKSETDDGLSSCSNFPERPWSYELESDKPILPEMEHLKGKIGEGDFEKLRDVLNRNADVFSKHKADIGCCNFVEHEIELERRCRSAQRRRKTNDTTQIGSVPSGNRNVA